MAWDNLSVSLRNDTGSPIVLGTLSIAASGSEPIWDTVSYTAGVIDNFAEVLSGIATFNEEIQGSNLVMVVNTVDQSVSEAFAQFAELTDVYNELGEARSEFSRLRLEGESTKGLELDAGGLDVFNSLGLFNAAILETIDITVSSNGTTVSLALQKSGGGDLTVQLSSAYLTYTAGNVALTPGTDTAPQLNYVYIEDQSGTATLVANTTGWPATEHAPVATVLVQSATGVQTDGAYKVHAWTDHVTSTNNQGHLSHLNYWIRQQSATWQTGVAPTLTIVGASSPDDVYFSATAGIVLQLHPHAFPALNMQTGDPAFVVNYPTTPYTRVTNLNSLLTDAQGVSMSARYFSLVVWGVVSEKTGDCQLMVNLPNGSYLIQADLDADANGYAVYDIPAAFKGTGFLIAELKLRHQTAGSGTWTEIETVDLRGLVPSAAAGAGGGIGTTEFSDGLFRIYDNADVAKQLAFEVAAITTATTRTITMPDADVNLADIALNNAHRGSTSNPHGTTLTNLTDTDLTGIEQGALLYRNATQWVVLTPGTAGQFLSTGGTGANPSWASGLALTSSAPVNVTKAAAAVGVGTTAARTDHKHDATTAAAVSVGAANAEGSATSLARSDHTHAVTNLAIASSAQGDVLYRNATVWTRLPAGTSGQFLQTQGAGANPQWASAAALTSTAPVNVTKAAAVVGVGTTAARHDHKHDITTAAAVSVGTANAEGTSTSLARADHTHQVTGLVIASEAQGDILYRNATTWVRLPAGTSGQYLQTQGAGANPQWSTIAGGGDVVGPASSVDYALAIFNGTTGKLLRQVAGLTTNASGGLNVPGDVAISVDGATLASPRLVGGVNMTSGEGMRYQFGDGNNGWQNGFDQCMQMWAYWPIVFEGGRETIGAPSMEAGLGGSNDMAVLFRNVVTTRPAVVIQGAASQTAALQEWRNSAGTVLAFVDAAGNFDLNNHHLDDVATANYDSWPTGSSGSAFSVLFDEYQARTLTLNSANVAITLNTPRGPGAYKLILIQDPTGGRNVTWAAEGGATIYAAGGTSGIAPDTNANTRTLYGIIYDGSAWYIVKSGSFQSI